MKLFNITIGREKKQAVRNAIPNNIKINEPLDEALFKPSQLRNLFGAFNEMLPNPDYVIQKLGVADEWNFYHEIKSDDMVTTCLESLDDGVLAYEWEIYQGESSDALFTMVRDMFGRLNLQEIISQICETPCYGRQFLVVDWEYGGGYWLPKWVESYPLELFEYNEEGYIMFRKGVEYTELTRVPDYRVLNPRHHPRLRSPMGDSILSKCYWNVFFKKNAKIFWNIASERYGMPWVISTYDQTILNQLYPTYTAEEAATALMNSIKAMVRDAVMVLPQGITNSLTNTMTTGSGNTYKSVVDECNAGISRVLLGHTGSSTATPGKLGGENGAMEVRNDKIEMRKRLVVQTFNELIQWVARINTNETALPVFRYKVTESIRKDMAEVDQILSTSFGIQLSKEYFVKNYHYNEDDITGFKAAEPTGLDNMIQNRLAPIAVRVVSGDIPDYDALRQEISKEFPNMTDRQTENYMSHIIDMTQFNSGKE